MSTIKGEMIKGNEAIAEAAIRAGARFYAGYPITPSSEIMEYMSWRMQEVGGAFVQAESEIAGINMIIGGSSCGVRSITASSGPGISLKQEGMTTLSDEELPAVVVNVVRYGNGIGTLLSAQCDYHRETRGGGNGDYKPLVYAPANLQEMVDTVQEAFDAADYYRNPVMVVGDGMIGQMMEPVELKPFVSKRQLAAKTWATDGTKGNRKPNIINSLFLDPAKLEEHNIRLQEKYKKIKENEAKAELFNMENAQIVIVAYGTTSRIAKNAIESLKEEGIEVGLIRPQTLWPFPDEAFKALPETCKGLLTVEMSMGQMIDDVKLAVACRLPVEFYGRAGGMIPEPDAIAAKIKEMLGGVK